MADQQVSPEVVIDLAEVRRSIDRIGRATLLQNGDPGGTSSGMEREQVTDMIAASDARTDTKFERVLGEMHTGFAEMRGRFDTIEARISHLPTTWAMVLTMLGVGLAVAGVILAALSFGSGLFGQGLSAGAIAKEAAQQALAARH